jgi:hypothetical protein
VRIVVDNEVEVVRGEGGRLHDPLLVGRPGIWMTLLNGQPCTSTSGRPLSIRR